MTKDPACKTVVNRVARTVRRITQKRALERCKTEMGNCEANPQLIWPVAKSLTEDADQRHRLEFMVLRTKISFNR
jgi:hypothetical protein